MALVVVVAAAAAVVAMAAFVVTVVGGDLVAEDVDVVVADVFVAVALEHSLTVLNVLFQKEHWKSLNRRYDLD